MMLSLSSLFHFSSGVPSFSSLFLLAWGPNTATYGKRKRNAARTFARYHSFWNHYISNLKTIIRSGPGKPNQRKVSSWTFHGGMPEQKFNLNRACFPKEKHQNSQKWAKFMNFSFWPFLWFGLPGRLLTLNHVTVIAENSWEFLSVTISCNSILQEKQGNCKCNAN